MPSRTAMVLAGRRASLRGARGDPIFGLIARGFARIARPIFRGVKSVIANRSKTAMVLAPGGGAIQSRAAGRVLTQGGRAVRAVGAALGLGAAFEAGSQLVDAVTGEPVEKKRRRMNVLNPKALSRSTRRLAGFNRRSKAVEKQLRKLCPPSRRRFSAPHRPATHPSVDV